MASSQSTSSDSLAAILSLYRDAAGQQLQASGSLDTKVGFVIAFDAALAGLVFHNAHPALVLLTVLFASILSSGISLLSRRFLFGPNPDFVYTSFAGNSLEDVHTVSIVLFSDALKFNDSHLAWKARFLLFGAVTFVAAALLLALQSVGVIV